MSASASRTSRVPGWVLAPALLIALAACSGQDAGQLTAAGRAHLDKKEYRAAQIEFKNALQKDPQLTEARFLLGRALLEAGDSVGALVEFNKLAEAGYDIEQLGPLKARAMFNQGDVDKLIAEWADKNLKTPAAQAQVKATLAMAYGIKGQMEKAGTAVDQALAADANNLEARLAHAQLLASSGKYPGAFEDVGLAAKAHPESARPYIVKAKLLEESRGAAADITGAYQEALKREPRSTQAHIGLISQQIRERQMDAAAAQLEQLRKIEPNGLPTVYYATLLSFERKDLKAATDGVAQLLKGAPENVAVLQLAGMVEFETAAYAQSAAHLGKAVLRASNPVPIRLMLARALMRSGEPKKALAALQPLTGDTEPQVEALTLAADAYSRIGDADKAKQLYQRAVSLDPKNQGARSALAVSDIGEGRLDQGLRTLQEVAKTSDQAQADLLLFGANLQARRFDEAAAAVEQLEHKQPGGALAPYLGGQLALAQGDQAKARTQFELAVKRDPAQIGSVAALGTMDVQAGKPDAALARYQALLAKAPRSLQAEMAVVSLKAQLGATSDQTRSELERLGKKYPESPEPGVAMTRLLLDKQDFKGAQQIARETLAAFPENPQALDMAGQAELSAGDLNQALQTFAKLSSLAPRSAVPLQRQAQVYLARQDGAGAVAQLRKAAALEPGNRDVQLQLVTVLARTGKADEALQQALSVQKQLPNDPLGWTMEGDLRVGRANYNAAVAAYRTSLDKARVGATAVKLHRSMEDAGKLKEAQAFEQEWRHDHPDDPLFNYYLGDRYLVLNKPDIAEGLYRNVLKAIPNDASSLNNLAWILGRKGDPEAIKFGERALAAAPNAPDFMDTVAELHANAGRTAQALTLQRRAVELAPNQPMLRLHLAQYLIKDNQRAAARKELETLAALGGKFSKQDEVKRLMDAP